MASPPSETATRSCKSKRSYVSEKTTQRLQRESLKKILAKEASERTEDEQALVDSSQEIIESIERSKRTRKLSQEHTEIYVDSESEIDAKCAQIGEMMRAAKYCIVYTGAGISTSASIPDYRGPNGLWTLLKKGVKVEAPDFAAVKPTVSHMVLKEMIDKHFIRYIVSQNCDGLHLRSGVGRDKLSELHGNCFIERCHECDLELVRRFDVTQNSAYRKHATGRVCPECGIAPLNDTIIHFSEKLRDGLPYNWHLAVEAVNQADFILCLGTSLKVLKHYKCLWPRGIRSKVNLCIVNIQWTPKDSMATLKVNAYCDDFMQRLAKLVDIKSEFAYEISRDPLFNYLAVDAPDGEKKVEPNADGDKIDNKNWFNRSFKSKKK